MTRHTWPSVLTPLIGGEDIETAATQWAMTEILDGNATAAQLAGFVIALRAKGETLDELQGFVDAMYDRAVTLDLDDRVVDIVGTGGDLAKTVNISSMAAVTIAGAGIGVVKHGNRAASSASGTADVFEELGVRLDVPANRILDVYREAGLTFCFAPVFHAGMRHAGPTRKELGVPTTFNFLGPLTNPARAQASAIGCADARMAPLMVGVLDRRGADALVFRGDDGLDEITITDTSTVWRAVGGEVVQETLDPRELGFELADPGALAGGDPAHNADVFRRVMAGEAGPVLDAVLLNAGAGIAAYEAGEGALVERLASGIAQARESIESGAAAAKLEAWAAATHRHAG
jgi:anthranilate phosphoribosyltransferase